MVSVFGLGNPLLDILLTGSQEDLTALGVVAGSMNLVDHSGQQAVIRRGTEPYRTAGGSCANTIRGIAWLRRTLARSKEPGLPLPPEPAYTGAVGSDENGAAFSGCLAAEGVELSLASKTTPTGTSAIIVTPDHERTMFTFLGACREYELSDLNESLLEKCTVFHTTGYMWDTENEEAAARRGIEYARERGKLVSFDVADPFVVHRFREKLVSYLPGRIDCLFANRDELIAMVGLEEEPETILVEAMRFAPVVVMKVGREGCYVASEAEGIVHVPGFPVEAKDTTGAGDAFAGGFLFARLLGAPLTEACRAANKLAAAVVQVNGCDYSLIPQENLLSVLREIPRTPATSHQEP
ncbi:MAG: adenosine kinase [Spirochaetaceae bacterium]